MCVRLMRRIDAVRIQRHSVVFVYRELGEPGSLPHRQTVAAPRPCLFIIDQGWLSSQRVKTWQLSPHLSLSLALSLLLFAQHLNALVQTLFSPAGRAVPYAHAVKAAVVMDTGKRQKIKQALDSTGEVSFSVYRRFSSPPLDLHAPLPDRRDTCEVIVLLMLLYLFCCVRLVSCTSVSGLHETSEVL